MTKKIISVGFDIPGYSDSFVPYSSNTSLLDADLVLIKPSFSEYYANETFRGKDVFDENNSSKLTRDTARWRREITTLLQAGKNVFVIGSQREDIFISVGNIQQSGSGRTARLLNQVEAYDNYKVLPTEVPFPVESIGKEIIPVDNPIFSTFWKEFGSFIRYCVYFPKKIDTALAHTKINLPVGAIFNIGLGKLIFLPDINFPESFTEEKNNKEFWTDDAVKTGISLIKIISEIDDSVNSTNDKTPPPTWTGENIYDLKESLGIMSKLNELEGKISELRDDYTALTSELNNSEVLKWLLFEKGKNLELAVTTALTHLGYKSENFEDGIVEIDHIITSPEKERLIGESEGKDNAPINIDKIRQLQSIIQDDLAKDEVKAPATGILFGNGFRLTKLANRPVQFTEKALITAKNSNLVLIQTSDLFFVARYLQENKDNEFARLCRETISKSKGKLVIFPKIPH